MIVTASSITFITPQVATARAFYERYFDTWSPFDCGWYVLVRLGKEPDAPEIGFMEPRDGAEPFRAGGMLNLTVDDVDHMHARMSSAGETIVIPLADNPWGHRGFGVIDPAGVVVYCHKAIPASDAFAPFIQKGPDVPRGA
ncbi:VOC family protein [Devosia nitrariae]|uniref:Glyoxalase/fosfomycin resistance/dioxygenase domain-containing protein n=1 Tax=Devosia nitrariae TaxID=2071872 RepID=A0ABQ5W1H3_9HYPH|nr:VOC family protein [Devosia nitrariae]GLQ53919.1 hypothetical protein GCM10010862_11780 [Devosia nitrariae]